MNDFSLLILGILRLFSLAYFPEFMDFLLAEMAAL